ncbi:MAG: 16S rRNA (cytidine(1402)-2'-O)-methyltransferase [Ruminococcaceae bacterium]|nr:16S rRNA (cytidine(1402)-2'-O)-methyltransferase [Oscillospiraceae bacterium]
MPGVLYLVATPIGNLADLSERAEKVMREVDFVACEDTRNSMKLMNLLGITKPVISYFEHNKAAKGPEIVSRLQSGQSCALVTDAGTPAISDPGEDLVRLCAESGVTVTSVPGCCAAITALILSGLPTGKFVFEGFLPSDKKGRQTRLNELSREERTLILYEAPHRLQDSLADMESILGAERPIALCRELTKRNEEIMRTTLKDAVAHYKLAEPRGEYVLILGGAKPKNEMFFAEMTIAQHVAFYEENGLSRMDAMKAAARDRGVGKSEIYKAIQSKQ